MRHCSLSTSHTWVKVVAVLKTGGLQGQASKEEIARGTGG